MNIFDSLVKNINMDIVCRKYSCNLLLNAGPEGTGYLTVIETEILKNIGKWIKINEEVVYTATPADVKAENADIFVKDDYYYAIIHKVQMTANVNVTRPEDNKKVKILTNKSIVDATWLDDNSAIDLIDNQSFMAKPFPYGVSLYARVAKFKLK